MDTKVDTYLLLPSRSAITLPRCDLGISLSRQNEAAAEINFRARSVELKIAKRETPAHVFSVFVVDSIVKHSVCLG